MAKARTCPYTPRDSMTPEQTSVIADLAGFVAVTDGWLDDAAHYAPPALAGGADIEAIRIAIHHTLDDVMRAADDAEHPRATMTQRAEARKAVDIGQRVLGLLADRAEEVAPDPEAAAWCHRQAEHGQHAAAAMGASQVLA